jgi:hypothetical protein
MVLPGCATTSTVLQGTASTAILVSSGYRALDKIDSDKQNAIRERAKTDIDGAKKEFGDWNLTYAKARKALNSVEDIVESAMKIAATLDKAGRVKWIVIIGQAATDLVKILADAGVKIGGL